MISRCSSSGGALGRKGNNAWAYIDARSLFFFFFLTDARSPELAAWCLLHYLEKRKLSLLLSLPLYIIYVDIDCCEVTYCSRVLLLEN